MRWLAFIAALLFSQVANATTYFTVSGGEIIDPNGHVFRPHGINVDMYHMALAVTNTSGSPIKALFPGINIIRLSTAALSGGTTAGAVYPTPTTELPQGDTGATNWTIAQFVAQATSAGVVVEIEDHTCYGGQFDGNICAPFTDGALTTETNYYTTMASYFSTNPYVWFGTLNEPNSTDGSYSPSAIAPISTQQNAIYAAIEAGQGTGTNHTMMMFLAGIGGGNNGTIGAGSGFIASYATAWRNVAWDLHFYGNPSGPTDQPSVNAELVGLWPDPASGGSGGSGIAGCNSITSGDGVIPVILGEYGVSKIDPPGPPDPDGNAVVTAAQNFTLGQWGNIAWSWNDQGNPDELVNNGSSGPPYSLTAYGMLVANWLKTFFGPFTPSIQ